MLGAESDAELYRFGAEPRAWVADEDATATINYTSGTTARPKGVQLTHRNLWVNATTFGWHVGVDDRDVYLHTLPMFHCNGWGMTYAVTAMGGRHVVLRKVDGAEILRRVDEHGVTLMCGAPAVLSAVLDAAADWRGPIPGRDRVRVVVAGAPPPTRTIERVERELGWEFLQIYGLTETSPLLTINRGRAEYDELTPAERARKLGRAGAPALGVRLRVDDQGEVLARSNVVLEGYWQQPEATADAIVDGWFHTGDGGTIDDEGYLAISDRKKDVIISGGENVSSIEVEDALISHPEVAEAAVIGVPDEKWGETVMALVVLVAGSEVTGAELIEHCRSRLAHYKCPTRVELRDELARTATGQAAEVQAPGAVLGRAHATGRMMRHGRHRVRAAMAAAVVGTLGLVAGGPAGAEDRPAVALGAGPGARSRRFGRVDPGRAPGARSSRPLHGVCQRRLRRLDGPAAHPPGRRARHRRPARVRPGAARSRPTSSRSSWRRSTVASSGATSTAGSSRSARRYRSPVPGEASFIVYDDGSYTVGQWGRDNDPNRQVVGLRQNLGLLVDGGAPTAAASNPGIWGASVAGVATARGGVGVDANGGLVWAGGRLSPLDLANALVAAGAVRAMELDINPDWVNFNSYDVGPDNVAHGNGLYGATGADRYLHPDGRDFIAVFVRGTVVTGATAKLGAAPLDGDGEGEVTVPGVSPWRSRGGGPSTAWRGTRRRPRAPLR